MNKYLLLHEHEYGVSHYVIETKMDEGQLLDIMPGFDPEEELTEEAERIFSILGIDFEPEKEESIVIVAFDSSVTNID